MHPFESASGRNVSASAHDHHVNLNYCLLQVSMSCGEKEHLQHVVEPSKCEYTAEFTTPAVCSLENAHKLQQEVLENEQALQGAHDEL